MGALEEAIGEQVARLLNVQVSFNFVQVWGGDFNAKTQDQTEGFYRRQRRSRRNRLEEEQAPRPWLLLWGGGLRRGLILAKIQRFNAKNAKAQGARGKGRGEKDFTPDCAWASLWSGPFFGRMAILSSNRRKGMTPIGRREVRVPGLADRCRCQPAARRLARP